MCYLISRQAAIETLEKFEKQCWEDMLRRLVEYEFRKINSYPMTITGIEQALNEVPVIQSQQKTGHY